MLQKFEEEGFEACSYSLEPLIQPRPATLRNTGQVPTPILAFLKFWNRAVMSEWKHRTNEYLEDHRENTFTKKHLFVYLGIIIKMSLSPHDKMNDHWKVCLPPPFFFF